MWHKAYVALENPGPNPGPQPKATMPPSFDLPDPMHTALVERYLHLTRTIMPALARSSKRRWPVQNDHCLQRIVLDTVCGGVWYDHIARPAYKHLSGEQAAHAVRLCDQIIAGTADLNMLNQQSLLWRGKARRSLAQDGATFFGEQSPGSLPLVFASTADSATN